MLSEMSNDSSVLCKVKEVEDDEEEEDDENRSPAESLSSSQHQTAESKTIEMLTRENAILRQQYNARIRPRTSAGSSYVGNGYSLRDYYPEDSDYAIDELDETNEGEATARRAAAGRRGSEFGTGLFGLQYSMDGKKAEAPHLKKTLWSSSPSLFAGDPSQSRRHSFANMPTRQGSISSVADSASTLEAPTPTGDGSVSQGFPSSFADSHAFPSSSAGAFFTGGSTLATSVQSMYSNPYMSPFGMPPPFSNRPPSPHRSVYSAAPPRHNQLLHIVLFKCARADAFYIQEGTGLTVKPGDLVIVEADRGTDLGTVARDNVDWQTAKELKEHYAEEQYKWLMMYSQNAAAAQESSGAGLLASNGVQGGAIGGMGPANQHHMQESSSGELRPKLIKRLAQNHEVHALRDKEGQEAKAKRVCMQKVKEHGLNMEILDAEFQMDWKKLTFYYFADSYINFNSLVTDLFKIYKTRIWIINISNTSTTRSTSNRKLFPAQDKRGACVPALARHQ
ncbi:Uncharacterized protein ESCO_001909 [Escovopsis weberi]|uniref:PSP1 C-terminal domain-containing protein n=1 Tax=Escovopsis weberi TaxID=150374 RepID=A0A0M9VWJ1_ESCWE|nr:Uncharacterized protein ESCO_001909 [Escovopsis weberi]